MNIKYLNDLINIDLLHVGHGTFDEDISYSNIISTFLRLYYIEEGEGEIITGKGKISLMKGYIYLIPSFESCSYLFKKGMSHYFIHCSLTLNKGFSPYNLFSTENKVPSIPIDMLLFKRLQEINPKMNIPHHDPNIYEKKIWMNNNLNFAGFNHHLETSGIIKQLFSRFLSESKRKDSDKLVKLNLQKIFSHIKNNINKDISVQTLAELSCLSCDHFSKTFKSAVGIGPCEFILRQRLEMAQVLLLTTQMSLQEICQTVNFKSLSYFSYIFKKHNEISPSAYRKQRIEPFA